MARKASLTESNKLFICENILLTPEVLAKKLNKPIGLVKEYHEKISSMRITGSNESQVEEAIKKSQQPSVYKQTVTMTDTASNTKATQDIKRNAPWIHYTDQAKN